MDAVILAGGYATRMWPITTHRPKMLLPLGDETVIDRLLAPLEADDRIEVVYLSTNRQFAPIFHEYVAEAAYQKPTLSVEETTAEADKLGVVGALAQLVDREGLSRDLLVVAGDNIFDFSMGEFVDFFEESGSTAVAVYDVGSRAKARAYGVVDVEDGQIVDFQEKPHRPASALVSVACYAFPASVLPEFETFVSAHDSDELGWFLQWLYERTPVSAFPFDGVWFDVGDPTSYLNAVEQTLQGANVIDENATLENVILEGNVHVMAGATIRDSSLERVVVFPESVIDGCSLRSSVVDTESYLRDLELAETLIGVSADTERTYTFLGGFRSAQASG